jgi:pimeloyl-ACP methyl ester carboxylesterase
VSEPEQLRLRAGELTFAALSWGPADGPLALCLHGYPDTARTWRHLGPDLAERGWRVVAPFTRGYAPTDLAPDGAYQLGALARDAIALHEALGGDERAVLIGHDWGASTTYMASAHAPERFARVVGMAVAPAPVLLAGARRPHLLVRQALASAYMYFQLVPGSERALPRLIPRLWRDWSPGYDAAEDIPDALAALAGPGRDTAALRYYRALFEPWMRSRKYAAEQRHLFDLPAAPLLYLHGAQDGCQIPEVARLAAGILEPPSRFEEIQGAGHFLHLEQPAQVNALIADFISSGISSTAYSRPSDST